MPLVAILSPGGQPPPTLPYSPSHPSTPCHAEWLLPSSYAPLAQHGKGQAKGRGGGVGDEEEVYERGVRGGGGGERKRLVLVVTGAED
jgi:hypothetical protein